MEYTKLALSGCSAVQYSTEQYSTVQYCVLCCEDKHEDERDLCRLIVDGCYGQPLPPPQSLPGPVLSSPLSPCHGAEVVDIQIVDQPVRLGEFRRVVAHKR